MRIYLFILIFLLPFVSNGQTSPSNKKSNKYFKKAISYFKFSDTLNAINYCDKAILKDINYTEPYVLKAQINYNNGNINGAVELLKTVLKIDSNYTQIYYILGYYLFNDNSINESKIFFKKYIQKEKDKSAQKSAIRYLEIIDFRINSIANPVEFKPYRLSSSINTKNKEYFPTISADNSTLIFTRLKYQNTNIVNEDIYVSHFINDSLQPVISISPLINSSANEGAHTLSADGMTMIFTRCVSGGSCDLFLTTKDVKGFWLTPYKLPAPVNTRYWESQPSLAPDGKTLYFASNRPNGKGKMDIWVTKCIGNDEWSKPINLGDSINSPGNEMSPFIHFDSKTLYFSSDYFPGMGKFDLFYSEKKDDKTWTKAKNLGYPINTSEDEYRLVVDALGDKAYFSSERDTVFQQDIYCFDFPEELRPVKTIFVRANIFREMDLAPIKADLISIIDLKNNDTLYITKNAQRFTVCLPSGGEYALNILKKDYLFYSQNFTLDKTNDSINYYDFTIYLKPILLNEKINLKNTFFETDSYNINPKSYVELIKLVQFLELNPSVSIQIAGHTDNIGTYEYNYKLSGNRAKSIKNYLISRGIDENRIKYIGYGYSKPIADNQTEEGRKLNRRTEIIILKK